MSRRRGRDACSPATARRWKVAARADESPAIARRRAGIRWRFTIAPTDQPSGFSALLASQDTGGLWISDGAAPLLDGAAPLLDGAGVIVESSGSPVDRSAQARTLAAFGLIPPGDVGVARPK